VAAARALSAGGMVAAMLDRISMRTVRMFHGGAVAAGFTL
jgi:hypothetical protein